MARDSAEQSNGISISWLKKQGCLPTPSGFRSGTISWKLGMSENKSSVGYSIVIDDQNDSYMRLHYTQTDRFTNEKSDMDFKIELTTTPCNFGGKRYWFVCPLTKNGKYCGRRVGVVYSIGKYFGCRHCGNLGYLAQAESKRFRGLTSVCIPDIDKAQAEVKRKYYKGKMTRKYKRFLEKERKFESNLIFMSAALDKSFAKHLPKQLKK